MQNLILCIDTSTQNCSAAIFRNGEIIDSIERSGSYIHAQMLMPFIDILLSKNNINKKQLSAIALGKGPGSYTGLRIGTATAKGLCVALQIPLIAINSLAIIAQQAIAQHDAINQNSVIVSMLDARRMEVYEAQYNHKLNVIQETKATIFEQEYFEILNPHTTYFFVGNGVNKIADVLSLKSNCVVLPIQEPSSIYMGSIAQKMFEEKSFESVEKFEPFYLKEFMLGTKKTNKNAAHNE
jgi:tRNA threonylcarbamoyladenosine biosynthesis protein TsaB